jgi:hypothetical protein
MVRRVAISRPLATLISDDGAPLQSQGTGMKRKSMIYGGAVIIGLTAVLLVLIAMLRFEPGFYREAEMSSGPERKRKSVEFLANFGQLVSGIKLDARWNGYFTTEQANSYLAENFITDGTIDNLLPEGVRDPRIAFEDGKVHFAFRYGTPPWSTVVSVDLRVWLVQKEYNLVALELERIRAGLLPVSGRSVLERMAETIRQHNRGIEFNWYRHDGHPVALLRFQADKVMPTIRLQQLDITHGQMLIQGCAIDAQGGDEGAPK